MLEQKFVHVEHGPANIHQRLGAVLGFLYVPLVQLQFLWCWLPREGGQKDRVNDLGIRMLGRDE